ERRNLVTMEPLQRCCHRQQAQDMHGDEAKNGAELGCGRRRQRVSAISPTLPAKALMTPCLREKLIRPKFVRRDRAPRRQAKVEATAALINDPPVPREVAVTDKARVDQPYLMGSTSRAPNDVPIGGTVAA